MQTHRNLTASYLWQPGELARRMLGQRPSPVPPTRELWPPAHPPPYNKSLNISTLHVAYLQEEPPPRRSISTSHVNLTYAPTTVPRELDYPKYCTVGTNTDPSPTIITKLRSLVKKNTKEPLPPPPPSCLTPQSRTPETKADKLNIAKKAFGNMKKAVTTKYRIAPDSEVVDSPKIVYNMPKPGDRMMTTFGARESQRLRWCRVPSGSNCARQIRAVGGWCTKNHVRTRQSSRRQPQPPCLQITQV